MADADTRVQYDVGGVLMDRPFKAGRLGHFGIFATDVDASTAFYRDMLGFRQTDTMLFGDPAAKLELSFLTYGADHHAMVLVPAVVGQAMDPYYAKGVTLNQISFQVGSLAEVVESHHLMKAREKDIFRIGRDMPGSNWAVYFRDPDGHMIELFYGMEQIGWDGLSKPRSLYERFGHFNEPSLPQPGEQAELAGVVGDGVSLADGTRSIETLAGSYDVGGVTIARPFKVVKTGPISLFVADVDAAIRFYRDDMGLALTEETTVNGQRCAFMRSNGDHHAIGLIPLALREQLGMPGRNTLAGYGMQVGSYRQLKDAVAWLTERGCRFIDLPADLHPGIDYAAHLVGPDDNVIQLYYYMEQVGWDGRPRPAAQRVKAIEPWPDAVAAHSDVFDNRTFQGPIG